MVSKLDKYAKYEIVEAIRKAEGGTSGEIRVHVRPKCTGDAMGEAKKMFKRLGMHQTVEKNAVLIFVAPKSHCFAIFGDEAMHQKVGETFWNGTRDLMQTHFLRDDIVGGIVSGVRSVGEKLAEYFPANAADTDELSNHVSGG